MLVLDTYNGYRVQLVKEEKSPTLVFKNPFKFISRLIYYFTGVGILFLLQGIFPTRGSNLGLLHCRRILYQLRYEGSPILFYVSIIYFKAYACLN